MTYLLQYHASTHICTNLHTHIPIHFIKYTHTLTYSLQYHASIHICTNLYTHIPLHFIIVHTYEYNHTKRYAQIFLILFHPHLITTPHHTTLPSLPSPPSPTNPPSLPPTNPTQPNLQAPVEDLGDLTSPLLEVRVTRALFRDKQDVVGQMVEAGVGVGGGVEVGIGVGAGIGGFGGVGPGAGLGGVGLMDGSVMSAPSLPPPAALPQLPTGDVFHLQVTPLGLSLYINPPILTLALLLLSDNYPCPCLTAKVIHHTLLITIQLTLLTTILPLTTTATSSPPLPSPTER